MQNLPCGHNLDVHQKWDFSNLLMRILGKILGALLSKSFLALGLLAKDSNVARKRHLHARCDRVASVAFGHVDFGDVARKFDKPRNPHSLFLY